MATISTLTSKEWLIIKYTYTDATYEHLVCGMRVTRERDENGLAFPPQVCPFCAARKVALAKEQEKAREKEKEEEGKND